MLRYASIPATKVVPAAGTTKINGLPPGTKTPLALVCDGTGEYPAVPCWPSAPAKAAARMTETKVKKAETVANLESMSNVRGIEQSHEMQAPITPQTMVQTGWPVIVFMYRPMMTICKP